MYAATVVGDSIAQGVRLTTLEVTFPRYILAEFNTHRTFSRNSASSRAIPVKTRLQQVRENPFIPEFTKNKSGMQGDGLLAESADRHAASYWVGASKMAAEFAENLTTVEVHKQQANRVLEPYVWHTAVVTATDWDNFFALRLHPDAAPEIQRTAAAMKAAMDASTPKKLEVGEWHVPYVEQSEMGYGHHNDPDIQIVAISVARCAAVSYERQHTQKSLEEYVARHDALKASGHWSPFEHQARVASPQEVQKYAYFKLEAGNVVVSPDGKTFVTDGRLTPVCIGNFQVPWLQYRKTIPGEAVFRG
jgi:thymidylate synthase ThyX